LELEQPFVDHAREKEFEVRLREIVLSICSAYPCEVFLFGSRARGDTKRSSDFDVGIRGLPATVFSELRRKIEDAVEEGNIPHDVDIVDFNRVLEPFSSIALKDRIVWKNA
jgi:predicted nucleotidyltransferase